MTQSIPATSSFIQRRKVLIALAEEGDSDAQNQMADICRTGDALTRIDLAAAVQWYTRAAAQGHAAARNNLGSMHLNGLGTPKDAAEAVTWYRLAAAQNEPTAQFNLGIQLQAGDGVDADPAQALRLIAAAAEGGYVEAQVHLGHRFRFGEGVPVDLVKAAEYFILAAAQGNIPAMGNLCDMEDEMKLLAITGNEDAAWCLKQMYASGLGVERSGYRWAEQDELMGDPSAVGDDLLWNMEYEAGRKPED